MTDAPPELGYRDAIARIEEILEEIDAGEPDIDRLAPLVEEAAALLARCRGKIDRTELKVQQALLLLEAPHDREPTSDDEDVPRS